MHQEHLRHGVRVHWAKSFIHLGSQSTQNHKKQQKRERENERGKEGEVLLVLDSLGSMLETHTHTEFCKSEGILWGRSRSREGGFGELEEADVAKRKLGVNGGMSGHQEDMSHCKLGAHTNALASIMAARLRLHSNNATKRDDHLPVENFLPPGTANSDEPPHLDVNGEERQRLQNSDVGAPDDRTMEKAKPNKEEREAQRIRQSAVRKARKASRAQAYEANWNERRIQDKKDETFSGWRQPVAGGELGGWVESSSPASSTTMTLEFNWKRKLQQELQEKDYGGWNQPTGEEPLGGWLYPENGVEDYRTEVEILGRKVMVTVAAKGATVERWLEQHQEEVKWGLDIEWRPTFRKGDCHSTALLQLSVAECCLLIQLQFIDILPDSLRHLLANPNIMLGGVGIRGDTNKLKKDFGLTCAGEVELTTLAVSKLQNSALKKAGIATLTEQVLGVPHKKNRRATMSNWENRELTHAQVEYAAADAWLSYSILIALLTLTEQPATQRISKEPAVQSVLDAGESSFSH